MKIPTKYMLVEVRKEDGAQCFRNPSAPQPHLQTIWLSGPDRARDAKVGDVGDMEYISTRGRGYFVFIPTMSVFP